MFLIFVCKASTLDKVCRQTSSCSTYLSARPQHWTRFVYKLPHVPHICLQGLNTGQGFSTDFLMLLIFVSKTSTLGKVCLQTFSCYSYLSARPQHWIRFVYTDFLMFLIFVWKASTLDKVCLYRLSHVPNICLQGLNTGQGLSTDFLMLLIFFLHFFLHVITQINFFEILRKVHEENNISYF